MLLLVRIKALYNEIDADTSAKVLDTIYGFEIIIFDSKHKQSASLTLIVDIINKQLKQFLTETTLKLQKQ